ncbi:hypothetical protein SAMN05421594_4198 [Chryseobacterium oleae]|uniref:Uncharacterized protein n=1 Tax=Chryseobacterium oleae TaxID=491207 RepID=A0A1I5BUK7_CHROL|nr:hypothetical protein [Chryseobacterium oleae]SFN78436.1 hypothetical protein SAMN05421594_4198 [Chryseobacterium oleae]
MKQNITHPNKNIQPGAQDQPCHDTVSHSVEEYEAHNIYRIDYSYPFMPMTDLTIVFDELKKIVKKWLFNKRERRIIDKKKIHETI